MRIRGFFWCGIFFFGWVERLFTFYFLTSSSFRFVWVRIGRIGLGGCLA
jgi:hypothetical protein